MAHFAVDFGNRLIDVSEFKEALLSFKGKKIYYRALVNSVTPVNTLEEETVIYTAFEATEGVEMDDSYIRIYGKGRNRIIIGLVEGDLLQYEETPNGLKLVKSSKTLVNQFYFELTESF